jgi:hypothetical protein
MFGRKEADQPRSTDPVVPKAPEPKHKLTVKVADLTWEIAKAPGSGNFKMFHEDGQSVPVNDVNTILLWEILKALHKA